MKRYLHFWFYFFNFLCNFPEFMFFNRKWEFFFTIPTRISLRKIVRDTDHSAHSELSSINIGHDSSWNNLCRWFRAIPVFDQMWHLSCSISTFFRDILINLIDSYKTWKNTTYTRLEKRRCPREFKAPILAIYNKLQLNIKEHHKNESISKINLAISSKNWFIILKFCHKGTGHSFQ